jgi:hypothetical protein
VRPSPSLPATWACRATRAIPLDRADLDRLTASRVLIVGNERNAAAVAVCDSAGDNVDAAPRAAHTIAPAHRTDGQCRR